MASRAERADLYTALAEALAEPSPWLCQAGRDWPLFELASHLLPNSTALPGMSMIQDESLALRQARYAALWRGGSETRPYGLSETAFLTGRLLGEATFAVAKWYARAGMEVAGSELPDGAAQELAFLAHLAANDPAGEKDFLKQHAALWLPDLGQALARGSDPVYAAIGQLLSDWLTRADSVSVVGVGLNPVPLTVPARLPVLGDAPACTLCGFCAQRCPSAALAIRETASQTALVLLVANCTGCGRCATVCDTKLISMQPAAAAVETKPVILRLSERVACKRCGQPTVSRAELDFVIKQIGQPAWLELCPACRMSVPVKTGD